MKIVNGIMSCDWDILQIAIDGNKIPLNTTSMGSRPYKISGSVEGVIANGKFNVCKEYIHTSLGKIFGYISKDNIDSEIIKITQVGEGTGEKVMWVKRNLIENY